MPRIALLTTGGTIAMHSTSTGSKEIDFTNSAVFDMLGPNLMENGMVDNDRTEVFVVDVLSKDSSAFTSADMDTVIDAIARVLTDPDVDGVVVTHGTDTMEETAFLAHLAHRAQGDPRPVVFTGAQRSADDSQTDGPANIRDAIAVALSYDARERGALISFGGNVSAAPGTTKRHTTDLAGFGTQLGAGASGISAVRSAKIHENLPGDIRVGDIRVGDIRVDIVALYPGVDNVAIDAYVAAGARGIVLEALGSGNTNAVVVDAVRRHSSNGVRFVVTTRVPDGMVEPLYSGGGGGADLLAAGAVLSGFLRAGQARILLMALLHAKCENAVIRGAFAEYADPNS